MICSSAVRHIQTDIDSSPGGWPTCDSIRKELLVTSNLDRTRQVTCRARPKTGLALINALLVTLLLAYRQFGN